MAHEIIEIEAIKCLAVDEREEENDSNEMIESKIVYEHIDRISNFARLGTYSGQRNVPTVRIELTNSPLFTVFSIVRNSWQPSSMVFTSNPKETVPTTSTANLNEERRQNCKRNQTKSNSHNLRQHKSIQSARCVWLCASRYV